MSHPRTQIREAAFGALAGLPEFSGHVFMTRTKLWAPSELPGLTIFTHNEEGGPRAHPIQGRELRLQTDIVLRCPPGVDVDRQIDDLALIVERALPADLAFMSLILDLYLESSDIETETDGDQPLVTASLVWNASYQLDTESMELTS